MPDPWNHFVSRWSDAGLIDAETAARIRTFEAQHAGSRQLRWPAWLALGFGAIMVGAGILLFVSSHWDEVSPAVRFALVLAMVGSLHVAGALAGRVPVLASALHAAGTMSLGAGVFLAAQIFNLHEHWPGGLMWWTVGAAIGWALLRDTAQFALLALLVPLWLGGEWIDATTNLWYFTQERVLVCGLFLIALAYFTAPSGSSLTPRRRSLMWIGGLALGPCAIALATLSAWTPTATGPAAAAIPEWLIATGWTVAFAVPVAVAVALQRLAVWRFLAACAWVAVLIYLEPHAWSRYAWWALGAIGLVVSGVETARTERINIGSAAFAITIIAFYFSAVMDRFGRSASLIGLGLLAIAGGWALERTRRGLIRHVRGGLA